MFPRARFDALSDGIFAVAMTLLVLDLRLPEDFHPHDERELLHALYELTPRFIPYALSFLVLGLRWLSGLQLRSHTETFGRGYFKWWPLYLLLVTCHHRGRPLPQPGAGDLGLRRQHRADRARGLRAVGRNPGGRARRIFARAAGFARNTCCIVAAGNRLELRQPAPGALGAGAQPGRTRGQPLATAGRGSEVVAGALSIPEQPAPLRGAPLSPGSASHS